MFIFASEKTIEKKNQELGKQLEGIDKILFNKLEKNRKKNTNQLFTEAE